MKPARSHVDEVLAEIEREDERQKEALRQFYARDRAPLKQPVPSRRALAIFFGIIFAGVIFVYSIARWWPL